jgi:hypothetical protein
LELDHLGDQLGQGLGGRWVALDMLKKKIKKNGFFVDSIPQIFIN